MEFRMLPECHYDLKAAEANYDRYKRRCTVIENRLKESPDDAPHWERERDACRNEFIAGIPHYTGLNYYTLPGLENEKDGVELLVRLAEATGYFRVQREATGQYLDTKIGQKTIKAKIDVVLHPTQALLDARWVNGPLGIECKRSGEKLAKPTSQALDYMRATFRDDATGNMFLLEQAFVWPAPLTYGDFGSIMNQHRIGSVFVDTECRLVFAMSQYPMLIVNLTNNKVSVIDLQNGYGRKRGHK